MTMLQRSLDTPEGDALCAWRGGAGAETTLLLVPGFFGDVDVFAAMERELGGELRLLSWDLRGLDVAPGEHAPRVSIAQHAKDGLRVADLAETATIVLLGYSAGAPIAAEMVRQAPDRFAAFVSIAGIFGGPIERILKRWLEPAAETVPWMLGVGALAGQGLSLPRWLREGVRSRLATRALHLSGMLGECIDERPVQELLARTAARDAGAIAAAWSSLAEHLVERERPEIAIPSLWIVGKRDPIAGPMVARLAAATATHPTMTSVRGGGHFLPLEQPELLSLQLLRFLRGALASDADAGSDRANAAAGEVA